MIQKNSKCDIQNCIIGAGVVGLAIARALSKAGQEVLVLERNSNIGTGEKMILDLDPLPSSFYSLLLSIAYCTVIVEDRNIVS